MKNLTFENIANACNGKVYFSDAVKDTEISEIVIDSRNVSKNCLFVAIKGERVDGHTFIEQCFENGAALAISEIKLETDNPYILVDSSLQAIKDIAEFYLSGLDVKVVGISGSVGKTSTKEMIYSVLSEKYNVLKTQGNFNNELGLPLTVFNIRPEHDIAVLEMGISDFGEMNRLSKIAKPDVCVITNIGLCHLENLKTRDGILKAKTEMFNNMKDDAKIVLNGDDDKLSTVGKVGDSVPVFYNIKDDDSENFVLGEIFADNLEMNGIEGINCTIHNRAEEFNVHINIPGRHMVYNALAAVAVANFFEMSNVEISRGIERLRPVSGRNNIMKIANVTLIDDCYNANPVSMKASIDVLSGVKTRKVAILGDMFELGDDEAELHGSIGEYLLDKNIEVVVLVGKLMINAYLKLNDVYSDQLYYFENMSDMLEELGRIIKDDDTVLIKASHGMKFDKIIDELKKKELTL